MFNTRFCLTQCCQRLPQPETALEQPLARLEDTSQIMLLPLLELMLDVHWHVLTVPVEGGSAERTFGGSRTQLH
jgi:hypothetical protein